MQEEFIRRITTEVRANAEVRAAWLTGSFGRCTADRYADVDVALLLADKSAFAAQAEAWLNRVASIVLYRLIFNGAMINAMTDEALRIDIWLYGHDDEAVLQEGKALLLVDKDDALRWTPAPPLSALSAEAAAHLESQIQEFWRMIALLPVVLGRKEYIVALQGLGFETAVLADLLIAHGGRRRERGIKNLNEYLDEDARMACEQALDFSLASPQELAQAHLRLAAIVQRVGPELADRYGFAYPQQLEETAVAYVRRELKRLGLSSVDF